MTRLKRFCLIIIMISQGLLSASGQVEKEMSYDEFVEIWNPHFENFLENKLVPGLQIVSNGTHPRIHQRGVECLVDEMEKWTVLEKKDGEVLTHYKRVSKLAVSEKREVCKDFSLSVPETEENRRIYPSQLSFINKTLFFINPNFLPQQLEKYKKNSPPYFKYKLLKVVQKGNEFKFGFKALKNDVPLWSGDVKIYLPLNKKTYLTWTDYNDGGEVKLETTMAISHSEEVIPILLGKDLSTIRMDEKVKVPGYIFFVESLKKEYGRLIKSFFKNKLKPGLQKNTVESYLLDEGTKKCLIKLTEKETLLTIKDDVVITHYKRFFQSGCQGVDLSKTSYRDKMKTVELKKVYPTILHFIQTPLSPTIQEYFSKADFKESEIDINGEQFNFSFKRDGDLLNRYRGFIKSKGPYNGTIFWELEDLENRGFFEGKQSFIQTQEDLTTF